MAGIYISRYTGIEIDDALMKALLFNPDENGWIHLPSTEDEPKLLDEITSNGNFIVEYFTGGPKAVEKMSPINVCVFDIESVLIQAITILDEVYYREFDYEMYTYGEWKTKKTTNTIYIDEKPIEPEKNTLAITQNDNGDYITEIFDGIKWVEVGPPDVMRGKMYDPQGRQTDFFEYVDNTFRQMSLGSFGIEWMDDSLSDIFSKQISCGRIDWNHNIVAILANSAKMVVMPETGASDILIIELPEIYENGQVGVLRSTLDETTFRIIIYDNISPSIYKSNPISDWSDTIVWTSIDLDTLPLAYVNENNDDNIFITPSANMVYGLQSGDLNKFSTQISFGIRYNSITEIESGSILSDGLYYRYHLDYRGVEGSTEGETFNTTEADSDVILVYQNDNSQVMNFITELEISSNINFYFHSSCNYFLPSGSYKDSNLNVVHSIYDNRGITDEYLAITCGDYLKSGLEAPDLSIYTISEAYMNFYVTQLKIEVQGMFGKFEFSREVIDKYIKLSNFKGYMNSWVGYGLTEFGRVDRIEIMDDTVSIFEFTYLDPTATWMVIHFEDAYLRFVGYYGEEEPFDVFLTTTYQDEDILSAVKNHITNESIHFTQKDRDILVTRETKENVEVKFNRVQANVKKYADELTEEAIADGLALEEAFAKLEAEYRLHISDLTKHPNETEREYWSSKAEPDHEHILDNRVKVHAHQVIGGTLDISLIPDGAKERITKVNTMEERNLLTKEHVQNGDRVAVYSEGIYEVVDDTKLAYMDDETGVIIPASDDAFYECSAGSGVFINWKNVENTPKTISGYGIDDTYTRSQFDELLARLIAEATKLLEDRYATYDLDELYETIQYTKEHIDEIKAEIDDAIAITQDVRQLEILVKEQNERMISMSEDLTEAQSIMAELLTLYS